MTPKKRSKIWRQSVCLLVLLSLVLACGCADKGKVKGTIESIQIANRIKPYEEMVMYMMDPGMYDDTNQHQIIAPLTNVMGMGTQLIDVPTFVEHGTLVYYGDPFMYAVKACWEAKEYDDPVFVIVSILPNKAMTKWPVKYVLNITDSEDRNHSFVAIQPVIEHSSENKYSTVGICRWWDGPDSFSLLFSQPL